MTPSRRALAALALTLACAGCGQAGASRADAPPTGPASPGSVSPGPVSPAPASPSPSASPLPTDALLGSQPATLDALRAEQALRPVWILVPGVSTPAPVEARTTDPVTGGFDLPQGAARVAWWASGAAPGNAGSVVMAAHVSYDGQTGPFTRLAAVAPGSVVVVTSADGSTHRYAVRSTRNAPKTALDRGELFRTTGPAALVLVTCGGPYDRVTHSFAENVVVTATPV